MAPEPLSLIPVGKPSESACRSPFHAEPPGRTSLQPATHSGCNISGISRPSPRRSVAAEEARARPKCRCWLGEPSPVANEPSSGADVGRGSPVLVQMWQRQAQARHRRSSGERLRPELAGLGTRTAGLHFSCVPLYFAGHTAVHNLYPVFSLPRITRTLIRIDPAGVHTTEVPVGDGQVA